MTLIIEAAVYDDLTTFVAYLKTQRDGSVGRLRRDFTRALGSIASQPRVYSLAEDDLPGWEVREYHIKRFRQRLLYSIDGQRLVLFAMLHTSRRPGAWHRRLDTIQ